MSLLELEENGFWEKGTASMGSEIRNQLQTLTGAVIEAPQLSQVGGKVFTNAQDAQGDFNALTSWWRSIHAPTYGQPIPGTASAASGSGDSPMLATATNQTALINALSLSNADPVNVADVSIEIDGAQVAAVQVPPSSTVPVVGLGGLPSLFLVEPQVLSQTVTGVSGSDLVFNLAYALVVQG